MGSKIAPRIVALAIGTAFVAVPALAQLQPLSPQPKKGTTQYLPSAAPPPPNGTPGQYYNYSSGPGPAAGSADRPAARIGARPVSARIIRKQGSIAALTASCTRVHEAKATPRAARQLRQASGAAMRC
jgi:hypothetical protein